MPSLRTTISTSRLLLRPPLQKDVSEVALHLNNKIISDNTLNIPFPYTKENAIQWVRKNREEWKQGLGYVFVILDNKTHALIGAMGLHMYPLHDRAEAGYWIAEPHWNKGYATEALQAVIRFGFTELQLHKIFATHMEHNPSSGRVMIKAGMKKEARLKDHYRKGERYVSVIQYKIINPAN